VTRRIVAFAAAATVFGTALLVATAGAAEPPVGLQRLDPGSGPPGTDISYMVTGSPNADAECRGSSAFATEFLANDGTRLGIGGDTIAVPATATAAPAFARLVCYVSDSTGRRVIRGVCGQFTVSAPGTARGPAAVAPSAASTIDSACPGSPRLVASQSVIRSETALGEAFNQVVAHLK
jgi:hypothetical protein